MKAIILGVVGAVLGCLLGVALVYADGMPQAASVQADNTDGLYEIMLITTAGIFGLVTVVLVAAVFKFRARQGDMRDAAPTHGHTGLEIVWTIIPAIIVIVFTGLAWNVLNENDVADAKGRLNITVHGILWDWNYDYSDLSGTVQTADGTFPYAVRGVHELVVPINTPIKFSIESDNVIHGWWVPEWRIQMNATPGQVNVISATPNKLGSFAVVCTFICGDEHPKMGTEVKGANPVRIRVVTRAAYQNAEAGHVVQGGCHAWKPAGTNGAVGPALDDLTAAAKAAGMPVADYVRESIVNPGKVVVSGFPNIMPKDLGSKLSAADLDELVKRISAGATQ